LGRTGEQQRMALAQKMEPLKSQAGANLASLRERPARKSHTDRNGSIDF
jgi:hypothetical protein